MPDYTLTITPEMRASLMHAKTLTVELPAMSPEDLAAAVLALDDDDRRRFDVLTEPRANLPGGFTPGDSVRLDGDAFTVLNEEIDEGRGLALQRVGEDWSVNIGAETIKELVRERIKKAEHDAGRDD